MPLRNRSGLPKPRRGSSPPDSAPADATCSMAAINLAIAAG